MANIGTDLVNRISLAFNNGAIGPSLTDDWFIEILISLFDWEDFKIISITLHYDYLKI